jgi:uncharacterized protein (TIRG00374 family)
MKRALKILVSALLIGALFWGLDWQDFVHQIKDMDVPLVILALVLLTVQFPLSAWKWKKSLEIHQLSFGFGHLLKAICIGTFFNNFLPTAIGGDAYRAYQTMESGAPKAHPVSSIVLERLLGIVALAVFGLCCAIILIYEDRLINSDLILTGVIAAGAGILILILAYMTKTLHFIWDRLTRIKKLQQVMEDIHTINEHPKAWRDLVILSIVFQINAITVISILFAAVNIDGAIIASGFTAAAAGVAAILPISINGIGVVEGSFVVAAMGCNLPYAEAVVVTLFLRLYALASSVVFGIFYALESKSGQEAPPRPGTE